MANYQSLLDEIRALAEGQGATDAQPYPYQQPQESAPLAPTAYAPERPLRMPAPDGMAGFFERLGNNTGGRPFGHVPFIAGAQRNPLTGRSSNSSPVMALIALAAGIANAKARQGMASAGERELFNRGEDTRASTRQQMRDAAFGEARKHAEGVRSERAKQMRDAMARYQADADRAEVNAASAPDDAARRSLEAVRDERRQRVATIEADLARLEGRSARAGGGAAKLQARPAKVAAGGAGSSTASNTADMSDLDGTVGTILDGIAAGTLSPEIEKYASRDGRLKNALAVGAVNRGLDLAQLRQSWTANNKGINTANSPQQLRMRQAAQNIPNLLDQMAGPMDANGMRSGGVLAQVNAGNIPVANQLVQWGKKATGNAGPLKQYNILANKLAMEQAFLMSGGNAPPTELYAHLLDQYRPSDNPDNVRNALDTVAETVRGYQESIGQVGPVTPSAPYSPGASTQNPIGGQSWALGTKPAAGMTGPKRPVPAGKRRVIHEDGTTMLVPASYVIPAGSGWRFE